MIVSLPSRGVGAAVLAAGLMLTGCSSDSDVPPVVASAPGGGTQVNTDTGSGGTFPDINTVPNQRPSSTIQDLVAAPDGLPAAQGGSRYGEALVGGPTASAAPPAPPPPPPPELPPIPEAGLQTEESDIAPAQTAAAPAGPYAAPDEPIATPEIAEPQPMEPIAEPALTASPGRVIDGTTSRPAAPESPAQPAPVTAAPSAPAAPVATPQPTSPPPQPQPAQQAYSPPQGTAAPESYGIEAPRSGQSTDQAYAPAPPPASPAPAASRAQPYFTGQPVGLIYFGSGSSDLSADDQAVLRQIAEIQQAYGAVITVIGHASTGAGGTGDGGSQEANQRVSEARANAVGLQLMRYGVPENAMRISAVGASQPLYSEATANGEAANRRVEVYLTAY